MAKDLDISSLTDDKVLEGKIIEGLVFGPVSEMDNNLKVLIYGESGAGKTTLAGSVVLSEEMMPALIIDCEGGTQSLRNRYDSIERVRVKNWDEMQKVYNYLYDNPDKYRTIVLDSLSEIQKLSMYHIMGAVVKDKPDRDEDIPSLREYGKSLEQMRKMVRAFRDLEMHVIMTCLSETSKDEITGEISTRPMLMGKFANEVPAFMDLVLYLYTKQKGQGDKIEISRHVLTQKTEKFVAKDRSGKLPIVMDNPTFNDIYSTVTN